MSVVSYEIGLLTAEEARSAVIAEVMRLARTPEARERVNPDVWENILNKIEITIPTDRDGYTHQTLNIWCQDTWVINAIRGKDFEGSDRVKTLTQIAPVSAEVRSMTPSERLRWEAEIISRPVKNYISQETREYVIRDDSGAIVEKYHYETDDISTYVVVNSYDGEEWNEDVYRVRYPDGNTEEWYADDEPGFTVRSIDLRVEPELQITSEYVEIDNPRDYEDSDVRVLSLSGGWAEIEDSYAPITTTTVLPPLFNPVFVFETEVELQEYNERLQRKYHAAMNRYPQKLKDYEDEQKTLRQGAYPRFKKPELPKEPEYLPPGTRALPLIRVETRYISDLIGESASRQSTQIIQCTRLPRGLNVKRLIEYLHQIYDKYAWNNRTTNGTLHKGPDGAKSFPIIAYGIKNNIEAVTISYRPGYDDGRDALIAHRFLDYSEKGIDHKLLFVHPDQDISDDFTTQPNNKLLTIGQQSREYRGPPRGGYKPHGGSRGRGR